MSDYVKAVVKTVVKAVVKTVVKTVSMFMYQRLCRCLSVSMYVNAQCCKPYDSSKGSSKDSSKDCEHVCECSVL